jgi:hypothetical protein
MSERGVFAVDRGIWDHPSFATEPFTEREAWQWLIGEASFKHRTKRIGSVVLKLDRGQVAASTRFMSDKWQWSEARVRRFLKRLKIDAMIDAATDAGITVVTICNYNKYQRVSLPRDAPNDAPNDAAATQQRRKVEDTESKEKIVEEVSRATPPSNRSAMELTEKLLVIAGHDLNFWPPGWCVAPMRVQVWLSAGWSPELIVATARAVMGRKRDGPPTSVKYFENAIAAEVAALAAPVPTGESPNVQTGSEQPSLRLLRSVPGQGGGYARIAGRLRAGQPSGS